jgi:hypothetical protein
VVGDDFGEVFMGPLVKTMTVIMVGVIGVVAMEIVAVVKLISQKETLEHVQCIEARDH